MLVKCPVCQAEYQSEPGIFTCKCGARFLVLADGAASLSDPGTVAGNSRTNIVDPDRTMAQQTQHGSSNSTDSSKTNDSSALIEEQLPNPANSRMRRLLIIPVLMTLLGISIFFLERYGVTRLLSRFSSDGSVLEDVPGFVVNYSIPDGVTDIGSCAFSDCKLLKSVTIPSSVTSIGHRAFAYCISMEHVTIPSSVTVIETDAFIFCDSLKKVTIPSSVTSIGIGAFSNCNSLESVVLSGGVSRIPAQAFSHCYSLKSITIPSSVTYIDGLAFSICRELKSLKIPSSVTGIGVNAFFGAGCEEQVKRDYPHLFKDSNENIE